jgi:hypothetical protein
MKHDTAAQYGVKKPRNNKSPTNAAITLTMRLKPVGQHLAALTTSVTATTDRNTPSAMPALPVGNIEKSLCTP